MNYEWKHAYILIQYKVSVYFMLIAVWMNEVKTLKRHKTEI